MNTFKRWSPARHTGLAAIVALGRLGSRQVVVSWLMVFLASSSFAMRADADLVTSGIVLDLEAGKGVTLDGSGNVSAWADQSGHGHDATQTVQANRPGFVGNGLNGGPTLAFSGNGQFLNLSGQVLSSQQFTIMALVTDGGAASGFREIFSNWSPSTFTQSVFLGHTGLNPTRVRFSDSFDNVGTVANPSAPSVLTGESTSTNSLVFQDTTLLAQKNAPLALRDLSDVYRIGTQGGGFEFWNGKIAAILVYDRALSVDERSQNVQYLENLAVVPEPSSIITSGLGLAIVGLESLRRRWKSRTTV